MAEEKAGKIEIKLYDAEVPKVFQPFLLSDIEMLTLSPVSQTAANFRALCTGKVSTSVPQKWDLRMTT